MGRPSCRMVFASCFVLRVPENQTSVRYDRKTTQHGWYGCLRW